MPLIDYSDDDRKLAEWCVVSDGYVGRCPKCGRHRLLQHGNGHVACEKCDWDVTTDAYAIGKPST